MHTQNSDTQMIQTFELLDRTLTEIKIFKKIKVKEMRRSVLPEN